MSKYNVGDKFVLEIDMLDEDDNLPTIYQSLKLQGVAFSDTSLDSLERLDSDYINEHYGELQDEAYVKGLNDGQNNMLDWSKQNENDSYKEGFTSACQTAHCGRHKQHFIFGGSVSLTVQSYRQPQAVTGTAAHCHSFV